MGNKQSHHDFHLGAMNHKEWNLQAKVGNKTILYNRHNPAQKLEQYVVSISQQKEFNKAQQLYLLRKDNPELVATKFCQIKRQHQTCSNTYYGQVYTQRIPVRLSNITHIPFPDVLHIYHQAFKGYQKLIKYLGFFKIDQHCIGVNNQHVAKVWDNSNFQQIYPMYSLDSQQAMVKNIIQIIQGNTDPLTMPKLAPNFLKFVFKQSHNIGFRQAKRKLEQYANYYNRGTIPNYLNCVAKVGGAQNIQNRYVSPLNHSIAQYPRRNSALRSTADDIIPKSINIQDKANIYRPSMANEYKSSIYAPEKRISTYPNSNVFNNDSLTNMNANTQIGKQQAYIYKNPYPFKETQFIAQNTRQQMRILTPPHTPPQHYNTTYLSPPQYNTYASKNIQRNTNQILHRSIQTGVSNMAPYNITNLKPESRPQFQKSNNLNINPVNHVYFKNDKQIIQTDHFRKKSQYDANYRKVIEPSSLQSSLNQQPQYNSKKAGVSIRNMITFNHRPINSQINSLNLPNFTQNQLLYNKTNQFKSKQIPNQSTFVNSNSIRKQSINIPQGQFPKKQDKMISSLNYKIPNILIQKNKSQINKKYCPQSLESSIRPKSQVYKSSLIKFQDINKRPSQAVKGLISQNSNKIQTNIVISKQQSEIPPKTKQKKQYKNLTDSNIAKGQKSQIEPKQQIKQKKVQDFKNEQYKVEIKANSVASQDAVLSEDDGYISPQFKTNQDAIKQFQKQHQSTTQKYSSSYPTSQTAKSNTPFFGSIQVSNLDSVQKKMPQLSFNQSDQIITNKDGSIPRNKPQSHNIANQALFPRNTFQSGNFIVQTSMNNNKQESDSEDRKTATYNRFSDIIEDEDDKFPNFDNYALVPNTGYDYGVSKNYHLDNSDSQINLGEVQNPKDDNLDENKVFGDYQSQIPPPIYEHNNFFDIKHNIGLNHPDDNSDIPNFRNSQKIGITQNKSGSQTKLASPDQQFLYLYKTPQQVFVHHNDHQVTSYRPSLQSQTHKNYKLNKMTDQPGLNSLNKYRQSVKVFSCYEDNNFFMTRKNQANHRSNYDYYNQARDSKNDRQQQQQNRQPEKQCENTKQLNNTLQDYSSYRDFKFSTYDYGISSGQNQLQQKVNKFYTKAMQQSDFKDSQRYKSQEQNNIYDQNILTDLK